MTKSELLLELEALSKQYSWTGTVPRQMLNDIIARGLIEGDEYGK